MFGTFFARRFPILNATSCTTNMEHLGHFLLDEQIFCLLAELHDGFARPWKRGFSFRGSCLMSTNWAFNVSQLSFLVQDLHVDLSALLELGHIQLEDGLRFVLGMSVLGLPVGLDHAAVAKGD
jgi:hypothetical protein